MSEHATGRLEVIGTGIYTSDEHEVWVASCGNGQANRQQINKANARRLVACWNACEMVDTEDLEALTRPGDVSWAATIDRVVRERDKLEAQRDELLEALQDLLFFDNGKPEFDAARAAIAKAIGEKQ